MMILSMTKHIALKEHQVHDQTKPGNLELTTVCHKPDRTRRDSMFVLGSICDLTHERVETCEFEMTSSSKEHSTRPSCCSVLKNAATKSESFRYEDLHGTSQGSSLFLALSKKQFSFAPVFLDYQNG